jgi:hypothetical protein
MLFQVVRGGIEFVWIFGQSHGPSAPRILSLVLGSEPTPMTNCSSELSGRQYRSKRLCRPIQFLWIERFSFLPNR